MPIFINEKLILGLSDISALPVMEFQEIEQLRLLPD